MATYLCIDLGGTDIKSACINEKNEVIFRYKYPSHAQEGSQKVAEALFHVSAKSGMTFDAAGICAPGRVLDDGSVGGMTPNIKDWQGFNLVNVIKEAAHCPVVCGNDANVAALGEALCGAAWGKKDVVMITLGTGVGGGIISEGNLVKGHGFYAGEIGHTKITASGRKCKCGQRGCIEAYAGRDGIVKTGISLLGKEIHSPKDIYDRAESGDSRAHEVFDKIGYQLAIALGNVVNTLNPQTIVIGGGVSAACKYLIPAIKKHIVRFAFKESVENLEIVRSTLGEDAGIFGCAALARSI